MIALGVVSFVLLVLVMVWRGRVKAKRAGLLSSRPVFSVEPPGGVLRRRSREVL